MPSDERPYHPHLTLARVREAAGLRAAALLEGLERTAARHVAGRGDYTVREPAVSEGPTYVPLQRTNVARM